MSLTRVTDEKVVKSAVRTIDRDFKARGKRFDTVIGFPGGSDDAVAYWVDEAGIWLSRHDEWDGEIINRFWCGYGTTNPAEGGPVPIAVEINFPRQGINRRVKGMLASDAEGRLLICHNGQLGGRLGAGTQEAFARFWGREMVSVLDDEGRSTDAFAVAEVGSERMVEQIAEYVRACAAVKAGDTKPETLGGPALFEGADDEFEGQKQVPAQSSYTARCDHGIVRNRLAALIKASGRKVSRDKSRDLVVGTPQAPDAELEIKAWCDPQSVYTAVGQLMVHGVRYPAKRRVAVLPDPVPLHVTKTLGKLGVEVLAFQWTKSSISFPGLDDLFPGTDTSSPIGKPPE